MPCTRPVSAHWQRLLLARLDAVAVIYRLASSAGRPYQFRWYRSAALDAAMMLPGGRTLGVIRQAATTDRTAFSDRVRWLANHQGALPRALLALMPEVAYADPDDVVWRITSTDAVLSLNEVLAHHRHALRRFLIARHLRQFLPDINGMVIGAVRGLPKNLPLPRFCDLVVIECQCGVFAPFNGLCHVAHQGVEVRWTPLLRQHEG